MTEAHASSGAARAMCFTDIPLDLRMLITFASVAEHSSFTAASRSLDRGQPWASEQIAKLEGQLGQPLFTRTSRRVALTSLGIALLPYARDVALANHEAQVFARRVRQASINRLRIGSSRALATEPMRRLIIEQFLRRSPHVDVSIVNDEGPRLLEMLRDHMLDIVITFGEGVDSSDRLETLSLASYRAQLLVAENDVLAHHVTVTAADFANRTIVCAPFRSDPHLQSRVLKPLAEAEAHCIEAPEGNREAVEAFARQRGLAAFRWRAPDAPRVVADGFVSIPIVEPRLECTLALVRNRGVLPGTAVEKVWRLATMLAREAVVSASQPSEKRRATR